MRFNVQTLGIGFKVPGCWVDGRSCQSTGFPNRLLDCGAARLPGWLGAGVQECRFAQFRVSGFQGYGYRVKSSGLWVLGCGLWVLGCGFRL